MVRQELSRPRPQCIPFSLIPRRRGISKLPQGHSPLYGGPLWLAMATALLLAGASIGTTGAAATGAVDRDTTVFDFEQRDQFNLWETSDYARISQTNAWRAGGQAAARIEFRQWSPADDRPEDRVRPDGERDILNPAPAPSRFAGIARAPLPIIQDSNLKLADFDFIEFTVRNPNQQRLFLDFELSATSGPRNIGFFHIDLMPGEEETYRIPLREFPVTPARDNINRFISGEQADGIVFRLDFPPANLDLQVDEVRLVLDPAYPLDAMIEKLDERQAQLPELRQQIDADRYGHLVFNRHGEVEVGLDLETILAAVGELRHRHRDNPRLTWEQIHQIRQEMERLQVQKRDFSLNWNRFLALAHASTTGRNTDFVLAVESPHRRVFLDEPRFAARFPADHRYRLDAARNESESLQVVVFPLGTDISNLRWEMSPLTNESGEAIQPTVRVVGYVQTCHLARSGRSRNDWWADPLLDHITVIDEIPSGEVLPLWVTVTVPAAAAAGEYSGTLTVTDGRSRQTLDLDLDVWDITLPRRSSLPSVNQFYRLTYSWLQDFNAPRSPANTFDERYRLTQARFDNWLLDYRMQPGNIYAWSPPNWSVERIRELVDRGLNAINLAYIRIHRRDADNYDEAEYWERVEGQIRRIRAAIPKFQEAGVWDNDDVLLYIHLFDEWPGDHIDIVYRTAVKLKEHFPDIKLITTAYDHSYGLSHEHGHLIDIWIPSGGRIASSRMHIDRARQQGRDFWWYFAVGAYAPYINYYWIENPVIEGRVAMGAMTYKYNKSGFLYWAVNRWMHNTPDNLGNAPRTQWNPGSFGSGHRNVAYGDGYLMYAYHDGNEDGLGTTPISSIRMESYRDGMEDYEYYVKLERLRRQAGMPAPRVNVPPEIVRHAGEFTGDPELLREWKKRMAREIIELRRRLIN